MKSRASQVAADITQSDLSQIMVEQSSNSAMVNLAMTIDDFQIQEQLKKKEIGKLDHLKRLLQPEVAKEQKTEELAKPVEEPAYSEDEFESDGERSCDEVLPPQDRYIVSLGGSKFEE